MRYSIIVPVYNRPDEVEELLSSLTALRYKGFEIIVVEDGSTTPCREVVARFVNETLAPKVRYFSKENSGPGQSRNFGAEKAEGKYLIFLDSDVTVPYGYFDAIEKELSENDADAFGGPDKADDSFTDVQKAISYSMTSFFTTGGIRGGRKKLDKFYPRSFNMGIKKSVFETLGGFSKMRFGEDIDLSIRVFEAGYNCRLFPQAWVCHKRRTDFKKFFKQVHNSGIARINLYKKHPSSLKAVHFLPSAFTAGTVLMFLGAFVTPWAWRLLLLYIMLIFVDSSLKNNCNFYIGALSVVAAFVQLYGYGTGFIRAWWERCVLGRGEFEAFSGNFYK